MVLVLLADDDTAQLTASANALLAAGHQVMTAVDGQEVMEELRWCYPDTLVCSSKLLGADRFQLLSQVRSDERFLTLRIVFMGHADDKDLRLAAFRSGVDDYLPSPFEPEELVRRLERALVRSDVAPKPPPSASVFDVQGRLENLSFDAVLRLLLGERKTGTLRAHCAGAQLAFALREGTLVSARSSESAAATLEQCLSDVHSWKTGSFWFAEQGPELEPLSQVDRNGASVARNRKRA